MQKNGLKSTPDKKFVVSFEQLHTYMLGNCA